MEQKIQLLTILRHIYSRRLTAFQKFYSEKDNKKVLNKKKQIIYWFSIGKKMKTLISHANLNFFVVKILTKAILFYMLIIEKKCFPCDSTEDYMTFDPLRHIS